jgi:hypothetical protein
MDPWLHPGVSWMQSGAARGRSWPLPRQTTLPASHLHTRAPSAYGAARPENTFQRAARMWLPLVSSAPEHLNQQPRRLKSILARPLSRAVRHGTLCRDSRKACGRPRYTRISAVPVPLGYCQAPRKQMECRVPTGVTCTDYYRFPVGSCLATVRSRSVDPRVRGRDRCSIRSGI